MGAERRWQTQQNTWLMIGGYLNLSQLFQPSSVDHLCPNYGVQTFLLYFNAFFSEQHCIVAAVKLDCCSLRQFTL